MPTAIINNPGSSSYRTSLGSTKRVFYYELIAKNDLKITRCYTVPMLNVVGAFVDVSAFIEHNGAVYNSRILIFSQSTMDNTDPKEFTFFNSPTIKAGDTFKIGFHWHEEGDNQNIAFRTTSRTTTSNIIDVGDFSFASGDADKYAFIKRTVTSTSVMSKLSGTDRPWLQFRYTLNDEPNINITSPIDAQTLYENDTMSIAGNVNDTNVGDVVSVKFSINGGPSQAITAIVSNGSATSFAKNLTYKSGKLYDGTTVLTDTLAEGSQHVVKIWAEDDKGGKSPEITRVFYVVPNRAATLTLDAFVTRTGLINTDVVNITGKVADLDNGNVIVKYKIGNGAYSQIFSGTVGSTPTAFNFNVALSQLMDGENTITIQAVDAFGAITQQILKIKKDKVEEPLKTAVTYYQITPPNGTADGLHLFIERELGDLVVSADIFMGANGATEIFVPMVLVGTANLANGNVEDTFTYQHNTDASKIVVRINMSRTGTTTNKAIKKISGVLM